MGPARSSRGRISSGDGMKAWNNTNYQGNRVGAVPFFNDNVDGRVYRRQLNDWLRFQKVCPDDSSRKLTMSEQIFAIKEAIRGSAGEQLECITDYVHAGMAEDEFYSIIDEILDVIDPITKEDHWMEASNIWDEMMKKEYSTNQTYDSFWKEFNHLWIRYAHYHESAKLPGMKEHFALMCMKKCKLNKTDFANVMEGTLRIQEKLQEKRKRVSHRFNSVLRSTKETMSTTSRISGIEVASSSSSSVVAAEKSKTHTISDVASKVRDLMHKVNEFTEANEEVSEFKAILEVLVDVDNMVKNLSSESKDIIPHVPIRTDLSSVSEESRKPEITLDALRTALRRLDKAAGGSCVSTKDDNRNFINTALTSNNVKCWICEGNHYARDNPVCKEKYAQKKKEKRDAKEKQKQGMVHTTQLGQSRTEEYVNARSLCDINDAHGWSVMTLDNSMQSYTQTTTMIQELDVTSKDEIIVDGGASGTVGGLAELASYCDKMGIIPEIEYLGRNANHWHAFGTPGNFSTPEKVIGHCNLPIPIGRGKHCHLRVKIIDGKVPIIMGKDSLISLDVIEAHGRGWLEIKHDNSRVKIQTKVNSKDGHARIILPPNAMLMNMMEATLSSKNDMDPHKLIKKIHSRTHFHPTTIELLLRRANKWTDGIDKVIREVHANCHRCLETGDPEISKKFNLNKLHKQFNDRVQIDIAYWKGKMFLHIVDYATSYSEAVPVQSRNMESLVLAFERTWIHRHGNCKEIYGDQEFESSFLLKWCKDRCVKFNPVPSRRHNKTGTVERKNRVIKDVLEKLDGDTSTKGYRFADLISSATFLSNVMYGNKNISSFEMARGYTPSIPGTDKV